MPAYVQFSRQGRRCSSRPETLRAAINHHAKENLHHGIVRIALPPKGAPRDRWLTRTKRRTDLGVLAVSRKTDHSPRAPKRADGRNRQAPAAPLGTLHPDRPVHRHARRCDCFISPYRDIGHSFVDLDHGIFYRLAIGRRAKTTPVACSHSPRLLAHMRRWVRRGIVTSHFVEWQARRSNPSRRASNTPSPWPDYGAE